VRLLVARPEEVRHSRFTTLPEQLSPGDVVVVNDSATVPGELDAELVRSGGAREAVVIHLAAAPSGASPGEENPVVEIRTAPDAARAVLDAGVGDRLFAGSAELTLLAAYPVEASPTGAGNRLWRARSRGPLTAELARAGRPIAYGYLDERFPLSAYQTVFATRPGSAEMPSAGRPFTTELVTRLVTRGIGIAPITLHTGLSSQETGEGPQPEWFEVPETTARLLNSARAAGGQIVAVGTTVTRALESAVDPSGLVVGRRGWTDRVISPSAPPQVVTGLVTGWHDPQASHLLLVEAVAGADLTRRAYDAAARGGYLWHEFGDSCLFLR